MIVIGPGDLYTSLIPPLLVSGVTDAITKSKAKLVFIVNLVTKRGETDDFKASDFVSEIKKYLGSASNLLAYVIVNKKLNWPKSKLTSWYSRYGSLPVENDLNNRSSGFKVVESNFADKTTLFRHNPEKTAKAIVDLL